MSKISHNTNTKYLSFFFQCYSCLFCSSICRRQLQQSKNSELNLLLYDILLSQDPYNTFIFMLFLMETSQTFYVVVCLAKLVCFLDEKKFTEIKFNILKVCLNTYS